MNTIDIININTVYIYIVSNIQTAFQGVGAGGEVGGANRGITTLLMLKLLLNKLVKLKTLVLFVK